MFIYFVGYIFLFLLLLVPIHVDITHRLCRYISSLFTLNNPIPRKIASSHWKAIAATEVALTRYARV